VTNRIGSVYITRRYFWFPNPWCCWEPEPRQCGMHSCSIRCYIYMYRKSNGKETNFFSYVRKTSEPCKVFSRPYSWWREWRGETSFSSVVVHVPPDVLFDCFDTKG